MTSCYIGLGANLDDPEQQIRTALQRLESLPRTHPLAYSSLYHSEPWGEADQPAFINAVAALETGLDAQPLMERLLEIERDMGRVRDGRRWGPRRIDLDLLIHGGTRRKSETLTLPHPRLHERAFVLVPLAEVAPDLDIPGRGKVGELLARVDTGGVKRLET